MKKAFTLIFFLVCISGSYAQELIDHPTETNKDTISKKTKIVNAIFLQDRFTLMTGSNGCFHSVSVEYTFIKKSDKVEVTYVKRYNQQDEKPKCKGIVKLSNEKFKAIQDLCIHGLNIKQSFCTTSVDFELKGKMQYVTFNDSRCSSDDDIMQQLEKIVGVCKDF